MRDWSYREAKDRADRRYKACVSKHEIPRKQYGGQLACACGWIGRSIQEWARHVDKECGPNGEA